MNKASCVLEEWNCILCPFFFRTLVFVASDFEMESAVCSHPMKTERSISLSDAECEFEGRIVAVVPPLDCPLRNGAIEVKFAEE